MVTVWDGVKFAFGWFVVFPLLMLIFGGGGCYVCASGYGAFRKDQQAAEQREANIANEQELGRRPDAFTQRETAEERARASREAWARLNRKLDALGFPDSAREWRERELARIDAQRARADARRVKREAAQAAAEARRAARAAEKAKRAARAVRRAESLEPTSGATQPTQAEYLRGVESVREILRQQHEAREREGAVQ